MGCWMRGKACDVGLVSYMKRGYCTVRVIKIIDHHVHVHVKSMKMWLFLCNGPALGPSS